jgi:hypothetical protein
MIKKALDEYLEFDSKLLFNRAPIPEYGIKLKRLTRIFGGAIRDIIAGQPINDIDIMVGPQSRPLVELTLEENGYAYIESLAPKDLASVYSDIQAISEPRTWMKGTKIVQIITPRVQPTDAAKRGVETRYYERGFVDLIQNVDISCCGVSWDGETLYENYPNAISHCVNLSFEINRSAKMYSRKRAQFRQFKLQDRGWTLIESGTAIARDQRIEAILSERAPIEYASELPEGIYGGSWTVESGLEDDLFPYL